MQCSTKRWIVQLARVRLHALVVLSVVVLAVAGRMPDSQAGWITCPPQVVVVPGSRRLRRGAQKRGGPPGHDAGRWQWLSRTWHIPLARSLLLGILWQVSGRPGPVWVSGLPWLVWSWRAVGVLWPWLRRQPEWQGIGWLLWQGQRLLMIAYLGLGMKALLRFQPVVASSVSIPRASGESVPWPVGQDGLWGQTGQHPLLVVGLGCLVCGGEEPRVEVVRQEDEGYQVTLCGHFTLQVAADHPFRVRMLMLFLRLLEIEEAQRRGRRTRDGRTPFVPQEQLAAWFQMPQPDISRIEGYWLDGDWPNLLSLKTAEVLTQELVGRIVEVFATVPWWGVEKVYQYLRGQGVEVSLRQVRQAAEQSGWSRLRQELVKRYHLTAESIRPRDGWLVEQLLAQIETLLHRLEAGAGLTPEEQAAVTDLRTLAAEAGMVAHPPLKALPWMMRVERVVFGHWEAVTDETVHCIYCGSTHVVRKSRKPRLKKYYDAEGNLQMVEPACRQTGCIATTVATKPVTSRPSPTCRLA